VSGFPLIVISPTRSAIEFSFPVAPSGRLHLAAFSSFQNAVRLILTVLNLTEGWEVNQAKSVFSVEKYSILRKRSPWNGSMGNVKLAKGLEKGDLQKQFSKTIDRPWSLC
jgi:hypothetical protein